MTFVNSQRMIHHLRPYRGGKALTRCCRLATAQMLMRMPGTAAQGEVELRLLYPGLVRRAVESLYDLADNPGVAARRILTEWKERVRAAELWLANDYKAMEPMVEWKNWFTLRGLTEYVAPFVARCLTPNSFRALGHACSGAYCISLWTRAEWPSWEMPHSVNPAKEKEVAGRLRAWQQCLLDDILGGSVCWTMPYALEPFPQQAKQLAQAVELGLADANLVLADWCEEEGFRTMAHHLRGPTHYRGCWAVDLVLGRR